VHVCASLGDRGEQFRRRTFDQLSGDGAIVPPDEPTVPGVLRVVLVASGFESGRVGEDVVRGVLPNDDGLVAKCVVQELAVGLLVLEVGVVVEITDEPVADGFKVLTRGLVVLEFADDLIGSGTQTELGVEEMFLCCCKDLADSSEKPVSQ
jgi:hypothetical protein